MSVLLAVAAVSVCLVVVICVVRYLSIKRRYASVHTGIDGDVSLPDPDFDGFIDRFARMIRIPTVSWTDLAKRDTAQFKRFQKELTVLYPRVHETLTREVLNDFGLIYHWPGKRRERKPVLFLAHYDVVPAEDKGDETWSHDPFCGAVIEDELWGRGTLDVKCQLAFQMEAAEALIGQGWQPDRDIYFAFGGDEEISGREGALNMAALFKERGIEFEFVLDEGGIIAKSQMAFLKDRPAALVGMAEKGFVTFKLTATGESGHSSMPDLNGTSISRLARAIVRLEKNRFPRRLDPVMVNMFERFVPHVSTGLGLVFANLWLTRPLILSILSKNKTMDSLIRTTQAVTVCRAGAQENVLPSEATCLVNHRILPGDSIEGIRQHHRRHLGPDLTVSEAGFWLANDPLTAGDVSDSGFRLVQGILAQTHPDAVAVPYLVNGSTDSKHYRDLTGQILRFCPLALTPDDVATIHGVNERVSLDNLKKGLDFYIRMFAAL